MDYGSSIRQLDLFRGILVGILLLGAEGGPKYRSCIIEKVVFSVCARMRINVTLDKHADRLLQSLKKFKKN